MTLESLFDRIFILVYTSIKNGNKRMTESQINPKRINKDLPVPYYYQIVQALRESIADLEEPDVNEKIALPSEPELSDLFSVNRGTIRHAL